ncbi:glucosidase 2 subunit beta-like isoform X2 [Antennarius striatus]|uniref:glucosidase 2 subunit beta-like isoform X2 n=1 Tax=Antennarius striatus TaxID=241820 RepID=UPI0035B039E5
MRFHVFISAFILCGFAEARKIRGISSSYKRFYRERRSFLCIDGSKIIPFDQVNDDYCDCEDGSDEPGTSACPRGRFYCTNLGFRPHYIPSSRVNDGICDCCDASDEYNSHARCQNTCWNLGQRERAYVEHQMRALDEGLQLKQQLIEEGVLLWREKQAQLRELQQAAEDLQIKLEEQKRRKNEADRLKEQKLKALEAGGSSLTRDNNTVTDIFTLLDVNNDGSITVDEVQAKVVLIHDEELILSEEEATTLLGGGLQMDLIKFQHTLWDILIKGDTFKIKNTRGDPHGEDPDLKAVDRGESLQLLPAYGKQQLSLPARISEGHTKESRAHGIDLLRLMGRRGVDEDEQAKAIQAGRHFFFFLLPSATFWMSNPVITFL